MVKNVSLSKAMVFWIESDPLSGGSRSQVEFPVEAGVFFGGSSSPTIGETLSVSLVSAGVHYPAKKMDFHHNDVWRLNLPTARQGHGPYGRTIVSFERTNKRAHFRFTVVPKGLPLADKLKRWARTHGKISFTLRSNKTKRYFGYF